MRRVHCFKCGSAEIDDGSSRLFTVLGVVVLIAGSIAALVSFATQTDPAGDYGMINQEAMLAGFVISYGFILINEGTKRAERMKCRVCGTEFTPPKPRLAQTE